MGVSIKCNIVGCLIYHDPFIIDEYNIWTIYEYYSPEFKVAVLKRWIKLYSDVDAFAQNVVSRCQSLLKEIEK